MAIYVLCDPVFRNTPWCDLKLRGIQDAAAKRREKVRLFTDLSSLVAVRKDAEKDSVLVLFDNITYIQDLSSALEHLSLPVILLNSPLEVALPVSYSLVSTDADLAARTAVDYLRQCGKRRIAMVGINRNSFGDCSRAAALRRYTRTEENNLFFADGSMEECFRMFLSVCGDFDAVLAPNDHLAICLLEFLKENGAENCERFLISYGDTVVARLYGDGLTSFSPRHYDCGRTAAETHFNRKKYGWSSSRILLPSELKIRGSTGNLPYTPSAVLPVANDILPRVQPTLFALPTNRIGRIERVLAASDLTDLKLLYGILGNYSYERIGDFCFLTVEAVKYRTRKLCRALACENKSDAAALLGRFLRLDRLQCVIEETEESRIGLPPNES